MTLREWQQKLASHDAAAKKAVLTLHNELATRTNQVGHPSETDQGQGRLQPSQTSLLLLGNVGSSGGKHLRYVSNCNVAECAPWCVLGEASVSSLSAPPGVCQVKRVCRS